MRRRPGVGLGRLKILARRTDLQSYCAIVRLARIIRAIRSLTRSGRTAGQEPLGSRYAYFDEPASTPWMKYRWNAKKTNSGTSIDRNEPAPITSMFDEKARICSFKA